MISEAFAPCRRVETAEPAMGAARQPRGRGPSIICALLLVLALAVSPHPAQVKPNLAGEIRALVPTGYILRSGAPDKTAQRSDPIYWQDLVRTERGARVRIGLLDGSILNVGSESSLRVVQHDPGEQQTQLELNYGRLRATATRITRPGGNVEVRTPVAVMGVVGTSFGLLATADFALVFCYVGATRVRNSDEGVPGEVILHAGEYTRVVRGMPPTPATAASAEQLRQEEDETSIPAGPIEWSRVEISWPPAGCGEEFTLQVRAWSKPAQGGSESDAPVDPELVTGRLVLDNATLVVEGGRATLSVPPGDKTPSGAFVPQGKQTAIPTKVWPPIKAVEGGGEGWRSPRAMFVGSAFYVLGPMGFADQPSFSFGGRSATLLWAGPCGAAFLAAGIPGGTYNVALSVGGQRVAHGEMNLVEVSYSLPRPPSVSKGQETRFGIELRGLAGLDRWTQGRPVVTTVLTNRTPAILGNLQSKTPGASASGETLTYRVTGQNIDTSGTARLEGTGRGRQAGAFDLRVEHNLDEALQLPKTPLTPMPSRP